MAGTATRVLQFGELEALAKRHGPVADWLIALAQELLSMGEQRRGADHPGWDVTITASWSEKPDVDLPGP